MTGLLIVALAGAVVASLLLIAFFVLESLRFREPRTWRRFGVASQEDANAIAPMAYNQGFYNLFLAIGTLVGATVMATTDHTQVGWSLMLFGCSVMVAAGVVLASTSRQLLRAALLQGVPPLLCLGAAAIRFG